MDRREERGLRFTPGEFKYNGRVACALLPSLLVLAGYGGKIPASIGLVGAMVSYILDAIRYREGALAAIWLTLGTVNLSLWFSEACFLSNRPLVMSFMISICSGITLFATGIWATLQFKWIQMQYPVVVLAFEKLLLATAFTISATFQSWGFIASVGASHAPFYLFVDLCILYHLLALPLNTSFHVRGPRESAIGGKVNEDLRIQNPLESAVAAFILTFLSGSLYFLVHWSVLSEAKHAWSILLLLSGPCLYLSLLKEGLWWISEDRRMTVRQILCLLSLGAFLAALEGRLIFPAFGQYLILHPPWNYLLVTLALYGFGAIAIIFFSGMLTGAEQSSLMGSVLLVSALLGSFAAGIPLPVIPAPMFAAGGLALFLQSREFKDYIFFVLGALCTFAWFIHHHFWFLEINLQEMSLQSFCVLLWVALIPALFLPGLYLTNAPSSISSILILAQVVLLSFLEEHLYIGVDEVEGEIYPAGMVLLTSCLGLLTARRLRSQNTMSKEVFWVLFSALIAKSTMLLLPHARLPVPLFFVIVSVSAPKLLEISSRIPNKQNPPVPPWISLACILAVVVSVLHARYAVYDLLHLALGERPSEGLLLGILILSVGLGLIPTWTNIHNRSRDGRRNLIMIMACGILLAILRPSLPYKGGADCPSWVPEVLCYRIWDAQHRPEDAEDDVLIWGEYGNQGSNWAVWILLGAGLSTLSTVTQESSSYKKPVRSSAVSLIGGVGVGLYIALEFFPGQMLVQGILVLSLALLAMSLFGLKLRGGASPRLLLFILIFWASTFPISLFLLEFVVSLPPLPERAIRLFPDSSILIEEQRQQANRAALLAVYSAQLLLLAFTMKLQISSAINSNEPEGLDQNAPATQVLRIGNMYAESAASFLGQCLPATRSLTSRSMSNKLKGPMAAIMSQLEGEGLGWLPSASNACLISCFAMSLILSKALEQDTDLSILVLSPMLLLLSQDPILHWLNAKRRYFPLTLTISIYLLVSSTIQVLSASRRLLAHESKLQTVKNLLFLGSSLPGHYLLNQYLWEPTWSSGLPPILALALSLCSAVFAKLTVLRLLAASGFVMSIAQYIARSQLRTEGMRLI